MKILVGVSGGVDSAVALHMLKSQGHSVVGAMMKIYSGDIKSIANSCYGTDKVKEENDALANCNHVGCEFLTVDLASEFDNVVFSEFKKQYLSGLTPNPCVMCNKLIKFGAFPKAIQKLGMQFDKFATGHYARNEFNSNTGRWELKKGINPKKDQTYFLYRLSQEELSNILFPLCGMQKEEVRDYAIKNSIPVAQKQDSQDFYKGDYSELFDVAPIKGELKDKYGNVLGYHDGIWNYTIGQRKGIGVAAAAPLYVVELRKETNEVVVAFKEESLNKGLIANKITLSAIDKITEPIKCQVKIRSSQEPKPATIKPWGEKIAVEFDELQSPIATGQSVVFYDDETVLGGGIIESVF